MKKLNTIFYVISALFALTMAASGLAKLTEQPDLVQATIELGYPLYLLKILGVAYLVGAVAIMQTKSESLRHWGYAGFSIALIGAAGSHLLAGQAVATAMPAMVLLAVLGVAVMLSQKVTRA